MTIDLNQTVATIEQILLTEQSSPIKSRGDIAASELRRKQIRTDLGSLNQQIALLRNRLNALPDLPNEMYMNWAEDMLSLFNLAIVVLDTTGTKEDSDIVGIHAIGNNGLPILDLVIAPQRQQTANTLYTGISEDEIALAPTLVDAWDQITRALKGRHFVSFNLSFVEDRLADNIQHYGLSRIPFLGDCLMEKAKEAYFGISSYGYGSGLKLSDACLRIGHQIPTNPPLAQDRAAGALALLRAMAQGVMSAPKTEPPAINKDTDLDELATKDHPF